MKKVNKLTKVLIELVKKPFSYKYYEHQPDYTFIVTLTIIILLGLITLSSASSVLAFQKFGDSYYFFKSQLIKGVLVGVILFFFASQIDYRKWKKFALLMFITSIALLVLVFFPGLGVTVNNAQSWLNFGLITFQPAEVVKFTFLIYLATWLEKKGERGLKDVQYGLLPFVTSVIIISILILAQPDLGTLLIILTISLIVYFIAGAPWKHLAGIAIFGLLIIFIAIALAPYRLERIKVLLNPETDPQGVGYQISQAKLAIGSGGFLGQGIGKSRQKFHYLPQVSEDSIFAIYAEELGLVFSLLLITLFLNLTIRGIKIARAAPDDFGKLVAVGIVGWFFVQTLLNIGAMVGLLPLTGLPLPFVSYGGTAMAIGLLASGVIVNISKQTR